MVRRNEKPRWSVRLGYFKRFEHRFSTLSNVSLANGINAMDVFISG